MQVLNLTEIEFLHAEKQLRSEQLILTIGYFDGVHLGHQELFQQTIQTAKKMTCKSAVLTFDFSQLSSMQKRSQHLITEHEKQQILATLGIDYYIKVTFSQKIKAMTPEHFIARLTTLFSIQTIIVGNDFHFGENRSGDTKTLQQLATKYHYTLQALPLIKTAEHKISSSEIEQLIRNGNVEHANVLLGYPYQITGQVIHGEQKGRQLGFPTANMLVLPDKIMLANGVYVVQVIVNGQKYDGMTNIGIAPTVKNISEHIIETNIFDFNQDIYGQTITVSFHKRIRPEQKFAGIEALQTQLKKDVAYSQTYLKRMR